MDLFHMREELWPDQIETVQTDSLELHDLHFQLCELQKWKGYKAGRKGRARLYSPREPARQEASDKTPRLAGKRKPADSLTSDDQPPRKK